MWSELPLEEKEYYKEMMLGFAALSELFAQKSEGEKIAPVINSKFQETIFQKAFQAEGEDIANTSYDASVDLKKHDREIKYLVGIKTFGISSGYQKVAQFKSAQREWAEDIAEINTNTVENVNGHNPTKEEISKANKDIYLKLAKRISKIRNQRIRSSEANLRGFNIENDDEICAVYHVLMTSPKGKDPQLYVGETPYTEIDLDNLKINGCTSVKTPSNFEFTDGQHIYHYSTADSQLLMNFDNYNIVKETWNVNYANDGPAILKTIYDSVYKKKSITFSPERPSSYITQSFSWLITDSRTGEVPLFSGFNGFYGVGSKLSKASREKRIDQLIKQYKPLANSQKDFDQLIEKIRCFLIEPAKTDADKKRKAISREQIIKQARVLEPSGRLETELKKLLYRPVNEMYIPIPNSKKFHQSFPDFFAPRAGELKNGKAVHPKEARAFTLTLEPSGESLRAFLVQDNLKGIESEKEQSRLGNWILRGVFQLEPYQPLTRRKLSEIGINGIRLYKCSDKTDVFLEFIEIDEFDLPDDFWS